MSLIPLYTRRILHAASQLFCGRHILDQDLSTDWQAREAGSEHYDYYFYTGQAATAKYYLLD